MYLCLRIIFEEDPYSPKTEILNTGERIYRQKKRKTTQNYHRADTGSFQFHYRSTL